MRVVSDFYESSPRLTWLEVVCIAFILAGTFVAALNDFVVKVAPVTASQQALAKMPLATFADSSMISRPDEGVLLRTSGSVLAAKKADSARAAR